MRAKKAAKKLQLHKETLVNLGYEDQRNVVGGATLGIRCITEVEICDTSTCYETAVLASCSTSIPTYC